MPDVIHPLNERWFDALALSMDRGRPRVIGEQLRERVCLIARTSPSDWGITALSIWSFAELRDHLVQRRSVVPVSIEMLERIQRAGGVSWQTTITGMRLHRPRLHHQDGPHPRAV
ncbi:hypothetical protein [Actinopolyspora alba]|uniref:hypothetical protein n=1 Tax=Actinopolyspora alba TaxID=673379 RepID=UPI00158729D2|nr:hypothetical protein [Actinopolyspora alba]